MKREGLWVLLKGIAFIGTGVSISLSGNLAQWANSDVWPSRINWVVIIVAAIGAGFTQLLSFTSGTYERWTQNGKEPPKP